MSTQKETAEGPTTPREKAHEIVQILEKDVEGIYALFEDKGLYYSDPTLHNLESTITSGLSRVKAMLASPSGEPDEIDSILEHLDYLIQQKDLFYLRKAVMDGDTSLPLGLKNITELGPAEASLREFPGSKVAIGLNPGIADPPSVQGFLPWEDGTGLKLDLLLADSGQTLAEKAVAIAQTRPNDLLVYKDGELDAFLAAQIISGELEVDDETRNLLVEAINLDQGTSTTGGSDAQQLFDLWRSKDMNGLMELLKPKKKT